jgi:hypothetical protein
MLWSYYDHATQDPEEVANMQHIPGGEVEIKDVIAL